MTELPSHDPADVEATVRGLSVWHGISSVAPLKGGVSNAAFVVDDASGRFVARVGSDYPFHQVSRAREAQAHRAAFEAGLSPELVFARDGVMVVRFQPGNGALSGQTIEMVPQLEGDSLRWDCTGGTLSPRSRPQACRPSK